MYKKDSASLRSAADRVLFNSERQTAKAVEQFPRLRAWLCPLSGPYQGIISSEEAAGLLSVRVGVPGCVSQRPTAATQSFTNSPPTTQDARVASSDLVPGRYEGGFKLWVSMEGGPASVLQYGTAATASGRCFGVPARCPPARRSAL